MLLKTGVRFEIIRQGSLETVAKGRQVVDNRPEIKSEFIYFATKAIAGDKPNGNGDYFPWDHLLKSYTTFIGRNLFLNHNSGDPRNAIGKVLDAYPVVDPTSNEKYIECLAKIDAVAHPELARQIQAGILDSCSMGCSVESSQCSVCGHTIYSDKDDKCQHMSHGLGKEYTSELDGQRIQAYAINRGLNFTELSVVNVPAWDNAKIVQVIAKLKERVANTSPETAKDLEDILQMASQNNLDKKADAAPEAAAPSTPTTEAPVAATPTEENKEETRESRLTKIFKEKLSALDFLDLQAFITKKEVEKVAHEVATPVAAAVETPAAAATTETTPAPAAEAAPVVEASKAEVAQEKKDVANLEKAEAIIEEVKASEKKEIADMKKEATAEATPATTTEAAPATTTEAAPATTTEAAPTTVTVAEAPAAAAEVPVEAAQDNKKLKAIFVSKANFKDSYWVVTDDGKPVLKASLGDIWGDKIADVQDYAASPVYGEALLQRLREDGVKKVALLTNATIYTEAADARGQVGKGEEWPSQKSVGNSQYTPAGDMGKAKMKKLPEGVEMSGGDTGAASTGPSGGKGDAYPTSKSMGKSQYKPAGYGGGPKAKTEKASSEEADIVKEAAAPMDTMPEAPAADMPADMPAAMDAPAAEMPAMDDAGAAAMKPLAEMTAEELVAHMMEAATMLAEKNQSKKMQKPVAAVEKAVEKVEQVLTKEQEAAAKEAEKEAAAAAKEAEKAAKAAEKDAKAAEKDKPKEEKAEDKKEEKGEEKEEKAEDKKEEKKDEGMEKTAEATPAPEAETPVVAEAPTVEAEVAQVLSARERELEAQLMQLKMEQSLRAKTARCQTIVNEMIDKDLITADEADIQAEIANGKPLFDARAAAFKTAVDKQCRDLLSMEEATLQAFSHTVKRMKGRTIPSAQGVLKKAFKLSVDESAGDDSWLGDVFNNMGSQKKSF